MDKTVPEAAQSILAFVYQHESRGNYECISSNKQHLLKKPITKMTVDELLADQVTWRSRFGTLSSAAGAGQIIQKTLLGLKKSLQLTGKERFDASLQDRLCFKLLRDRGYDAWIGGRIDNNEFALRIAKEWASMPVLAGTKNAKGANIKRGQGYYDGDGLNAAAKNTADIFEDILKIAKKQSTDVLPVAPKPATKTAQEVAIAVGSGALVVGGAEEATKSVTSWEPVISLASQIGKYGPWVAGGIVLVVVALIIGKRVWKG